jgi:hypothetical protein
MVGIPTQMCDPAKDFGELYDPETAVRKRQEVRKLFHCPGKEARKLSVEEVPPGGTSIPMLSPFKTPLIVSLGEFSVLVQK